MQDNGYNDRTMNVGKAGTDAGATFRNAMEYSIPTMPKTPHGPSQAVALFMNRYRVIEKAGEGGMGVVYHCIDEKSNNRHVVLKMLPPEHSRDGNIIESIKANFKLVCGLNHPNIAASHQIEQDPASGDCYIIMEYVNGESLRTKLNDRHLKREGFSLAEALPILRQIASALDFAHGERIIHRDIKPENVMLDLKGKVKVLDFGLAEQLHSTNSTRARAFKLQPGEDGLAGTAAYMAPEQWRCEWTKAPADQYALAVTAYEMLAGHVPFDGPDSLLMNAVLNNDPEPVEGIPGYAWKALARGLAKKPEDRFASCADFVDALEGRKSVSGGNAKKNGRAAFIGGAVLVVLLALWGATVLLKPETPAAPSPAPPETQSSQPEPAVSQSDVSPVPAPPETQSTQSEPADWGGIHEETIALKKMEFTGTVSLSGNVTLEMVKIQAGSFQMGSPASEKGRESNETLHRVKLTKDYWLGKYEVTQEQYEAVMGTNPSNFKNGGNYPVECVSWNDTMDFCRKLNERMKGKLPSGYKFSLPTEAQWEYAARGGNQSRHSVYSGSNDCNSVAWYGSNSDHSSHPVGLKQPNELGLYDMSGNVEEWCSDRYGDYPSGNQRNPVGPTTGSYRVRRGGGWRRDAGSCRSACRNDFDPGFCLNFLGFRLALVPVQ